MNDNELLRKAMTAETERRARMKLIEKLYEWDAESGTYRIRYEYKIVGGRFIERLVDGVE